jgi:acyl dehydratase
LPEPLGRRQQAPEGTDVPIDLDVALGAQLEPVEFAWSSSDVQTYHLALGAGTDPMDPRELRYLSDGTPQVLPTFSSVAASFHVTESPTVSFPGIDIELSRVLHASEAVHVPAPLPPSGAGRASTRITDIWDKGKAAVIVTETAVTDLDGSPLWNAKRSIFARGEGGFGGERGPSASAVTPDRAPDVRIDVPVLPQQALLYRMCGDRNPLHSDPGFASAAGFPRPILHGLCTYGMTCKALVDTLLDGDAGRVRSYGARFAGVVFPGETIRVSVWRNGDGDGDGYVGVVTAPARDDVTVLSDVTLLPV